MALSGIAVQHADVCYSRRGNFGGSLVHSVFLMYSPDGTNVYNRGVGVESCKFMFLEHFLFTC